MKFDLTENGYSVEQVDAYLSRIKQVYEEIIKKQREYLDKLKEENGELLTKNKKFEEEKETLAKAIKNAIDKTD
ncbi:MAG: DivIVA domain-containing protein [Clostridia bacterium]|nr:DivIVA domain-containing protein [Clostridia bacterium]